MAIYDRKRSCPIPKQKVMTKNHTKKIGSVFFTSVFRRHSLQFPFFFNVVLLCIVMHAGESITTATEN